MAQIKQTVELLTKILRSNGLSKVKAEVFRKAKLDSDDATEPLWKILFELLYYLHYDVLDDVTVQSYAQLSKAELTTYVKTEMKMRGFVSRSFHELRNDMSSGSRELLLGFGWLLCRGEIMDKFMEKCCSSLDSIPTPVVDIAPIQRSLPEGDPLTKIKYLMGLNGKLRMSLRNLHILQQHKDRLIQAVEDATEGRLSVLEVMMLKNPDLLKRNLRLLELDNERLEALTKWNDHEDLFWKWMESVLDAKLAACGEIDEVSAVITPRTNQEKQRLDNKLSLAEAVTKYERIVEQLEKDIKTHRGDLHTPVELDSLLESINTEISLHMANLRLQTPPTPVARIAPLRREASVSSVASLSVAEREIVKMETELNNLQGLLTKLQADIEFKQYKYKDEISSLSGVDDESLLGPAAFVTNRT